VACTVVGTSPRPVMKMIGIQQNTRPAPRPQSPMTVGRARPFVSS
jgi:hypothetical protein